MKQCVFGSVRLIPYVFMRIEKAHQTEIWTKIPDTLCISLKGTFARDIECIHFEAAKNRIKYDTQYSNYKTFI